MPRSGPSVTMLLGQRCGAALHLPTWRATGLGSAVARAAAVASRAVKATVKEATEGASREGRMVLSGATGGRSGVVLQLARAARVWPETCDPGGAQQQERRRQWHSVPGASSAS